MKKTLPAQLKPFFGFFILLSFFAWAFLLIIPRSIQAQGCGVAGTVTNSAGEKVEGAGVYIHYPKGIVIGEDKTDATGSYSISGLPCDKQLIEYIVCAGPFLDEGETFGPIGSGTHTLNRSEIDCMVGPVPPGPGPGPGPPAPLPVCNPQECDGSWWEQFLGHCERTSRPVDCKPCNTTSRFCPACATSFTVHDTVKYIREDDDYWCNGQPWLIRNWGGIVTINPKDVSIPFVGKQWESGDVHEDEEKYLADYFEGTHDYYRTYPLKIGPFEGALHGVNPILTINYQGILRKLTPMRYQDQLKKEIIERIASGGPPQEGGIHNYDLNYIERLCWDASFWVDVFAEVARIILEKGDINVDPHQITHYCLYRFNAIDEVAITLVKGALEDFNTISPFKISISHQEGVRMRLSALRNNYPPEPDEEDYVKKWDDWNFSSPSKLSVAARLWQVAPMVSREDTPGYITPYLGSRPNDTFEILNPSAQIEEVPHVARLFEASGEIQKMLLPYTEGGLTQEVKGPIIASAKEEILGEKTLLAQACGLPDPLSVDPCEKPAMTDSNPNDSLCCQEIGINLSAEDHFVNQCHEECRYGEICGPDPVCEAPPCPPYPLAAQYPAQSYVLAASYLAQSGEPCLYCERCEGSGTHQCHGTIQDGACKYDPAVAPNCTSCKFCGDGVCDVCEGADWCPQDCEAPVPCHWGLLNPCCKKEETQPVSREVGVSLLHPYLSAIWDQTSRTDTSGLFNFFRPKEVPEFIDIDAADKISYRYQDTSDPGGGYLAPETGLFYFNHLGGVQIAKDWLIRALYPYQE